MACLLVAEKDSLNARIDTFQAFQGKAIRDNKGDVKAMSTAAMATQDHYSSTPDDPKHDHCPGVRSRAAVTSSV